MHPGDDTPGGAVLPQETIPTFQALGRICGAPTVACPRPFQWPFPASGLARKHWRCWPTMMWKPWMWWQTPSLRPNVRTCAFPLLRQCRIQALYKGHRLTPEMAVKRCPVTWIARIPADSRRAPGTRALGCIPLPPGIPWPDKNAWVSTAEWPDIYSFSAPWPLAQSAASPNRRRPNPFPRSSWDTCKEVRSRYCPWEPKGLCSTEAKPFKFPSQNAPNTTPPAERVCCRQVTRKA